MSNKTSTKIKKNDYAPTALTKYNQRGGAQTPTLRKPTPPPSPKQPKNKK